MSIVSSICIESIQLINKYKCKGSFQNINKYIQILHISQTSKIIFIAFQIISIKKQFIININSLKHTNLQTTKINLKNYLRNFFHLCLYTMKHCRAWLKAEGKFFIILISNSKMDKQQKTKHPNFNNFSNKFQVRKPNDIYKSIQSKQICIRTDFILQIPQQSYMQAGATITPKEEPATSGKIILFTTNGQIQIQLWAKQMPLACRNFVQHCLDGYYDSTIFHRMIPGFMIQGGDPTGTGSGGQSIYKQPFKNQYHQKIKFGRRGMVAMANSGKDINKSQFFMTFGECNHLNKDHTIFGKVVGDSIYNLLSYQSLDTQKGTDRPTDPPYIRKTKVVDNPFEDLVPRVIKPEKEVEPQKAQEPKKKINKTQMKKLKNKKRLTFQDEDEEVEQTNYKIKSSHDMLNDDKLSNQVAITAEQLELKRKQKQQEEKKKQELIDRVNQAANNKDNQPTNKSISKMLDDQLHRKKKMADNSSSLQIQDEILNYKKTLNSQTGKIQIHWGKDQPIQQVQQEHQDSEQKMKHLRQLQQRQYQAMRIDQLNFKQLKEGTLKQRRKQLVAQEKQLLSNVQKRKYQFLKKQKMAEREDPLFDKLQKFKGRLAINKPNDWMCHKLKFHIDSQNAYDLDKKNKERQLRDQQQQD